MALMETLLLLLLLQVEITLQDVNDNPPVFPNDILDMTIEENVGDGFKIMQLTATDADEVSRPNGRLFDWFCNYLRPFSSQPLLGQKSWESFELK